MANAFLLMANTRDDIGKGASRRLRRQNLVPAVVYGGSDSPQSITIKHSDILKCLNDNSFYSQIIDVNIDGDITETILRDMQRHPYKPTILHLDFQRVVRGQELSVQVPLNFTNTDSAKGVKAGGILSQHIINVEVICRPSKIPEFITVDVLELDINESLRLKDIAIPEDVRLTALEQSDGKDDDSNIQIVSIHPPKAEVVQESSTDVEQSEDTATNTE